MTTSTSNETHADKGLRMFFERVAALLTSRETDGNWKCEAVTKWPGMGGEHTVHYLTGPDGLRFSIYRDRSNNAAKGRVCVSQEFPQDPADSRGIRTVDPVSMDERKPEIGVNIEKREPAAIARDINRRLLLDGRAARLAGHAALMVEREHQAQARAVDTRGDLEALPGVRVSESGNGSYLYLPDSVDLRACLRDGGGVSVSRGTLQANQIGALIALEDVVSLLDEMSTTSNTQEAERMRLLGMLRG